MDERFEAIRLKIVKAKAFTPEVTRELEQLHQDDPTHAGTRAALVQAYLRREDWNGLATLLEEQPVEARSVSDRVQLATVLGRAQRFDEALANVEGLVSAEGRGESLEAAWITAYAAFHTDQLDRARTILDANMAEFLASDKSDALLFRGLIHFQTGEFEEAERTLKRLLEQDENNVLAHDAIGRVLVAAGDREGGKQHLAQAAKIRDANTKAEQLALRMTAMTKALNAAWEREDFDACDRYIGEMLPNVRREQKIELYKYLAAVRRKQGREEEAGDALAKAKQLEELPDSRS